MKYLAKGLSIAFEGRENQDAWGIGGPGSFRLVAAVADGVGGHKGGAVAAKLAINKVIEFIDQNELNFERILRSIVNEISKAASPNERDMATTLSLIVFEDDKARFAHVGDSRIYHLRGKGVVQITEDQTEAAVLVKEGILTPQQARVYPRRSVLVSALSAHAEYNADFGEVFVQFADRFVLMTDGVYRVLSKSKIRDISIACKSLDEFLKGIEQELRRTELKDDATVVVVEHIGD